MVRNQKSYTVEEAQKALERFCSYQERTHKEVDEKLRSLGMIPMVCEKIILHLMQNDFLNEERYAKSFVSGKFNINKWGRIKIRQALTQKGISSANLQIGLTEIDEEEYKNTLQSLISKYQLNNKETNPYKRKQKAFKYLQQKGYETSEILECLSDGDI